MTFFKQRASRVVQLYGAAALGILLPSAFLIGMSIRSLHQARVLSAQEAEHRLRSSAEALRDDLAHWTNVYVEEGRKIVRSWPQRRESALFETMQETQFILGLPVQNVFILNDRGDVLGPPRLTAKPPRLSMAWGPLEPDIEHFDRLENVRQSHNEAAVGYAALRQQKVTPQQDAQLLLRLARAQVALAKADQAVHFYDELSSRYGNLIMPEGVPYAVPALIERADTEEQSGRHTAAWQDRLKLYRLLTFEGWPGFPKVYRQLDSLLDSAPPAVQMELRRLCKLRDRSETARAVAAHFAENAWPQVIDLMKRAGRLDAGGIFRLDKSGESYSLATRAHQDNLLVICPWPSKGQREGFICFLTASKSFDSHLDQSARELSAPLGATFLIEAKGSDRPSSDFLQRIDSVSPSLYIRFEENFTSPAVANARHQHFFFACVIVASVVMLCVGFFLMVSAAQREHELADLKADFVASVSHELRTPLTSIAYIGELLQTGRFRSEKELQEFSGMLQEETVRLRELVEEALDFAKVVSGKKTYRTELADLAILAEDALKRFEGKARAYGVALAAQIPEGDFSVRVDSRAVIRAIMNLLDNAAKYAGESRNISLRVESEKGHRSVAVEDHGPGIDEAELPFIFEKFYRAQKGGSTTRHGGFGLGLAMVKHIVEGNGGVIRVASQVGKGSVFTLLFPEAQGTLS